MDPPVGSDAQQCQQSQAFSKEGIPCLFPESGMFWLALSLSDPGTWADSLPFSELKFPDLQVHQGPRISRSSQFQNLRMELS